MKAQAWQQNRDPLPRGLVYRIHPGAGVGQGRLFTPYWAGIITMWSEDEQERVIYVTGAAVGDTREETLRRLSRTLQYMRESATLKAELGFTP